MGRILAIIVLVVMGVVVLDQGSQVLRAAQLKQIEVLEEI